MHADISRMLLESIKESARKEAESVSVPDIEVQKETLKEFIATSIDFKVGDFIRLNRYGKQRYKFPTSKQIGIISDVFDTIVIDNDGERIHGTFTINQRTHLQTYTMDFRYIEIAG